MELGQRGKIATHQHDITDTGTSRAMIEVGMRQRLQRLKCRVYFTDTHSPQLFPQGGVNGACDRDPGNGSIDTFKSTTTETPGLRLPTKRICSAQRSVTVYCALTIMHAVVALDNCIARRKVLPV
jgi:hypothetical protein